MMNEAKEKKWLFAALMSLLVLANVFLLFMMRPLVIQIFSFIKTVFLPFFMALIISYILHPVVTLLTSRMVPRAVAVLLIYATFTVSSLIVMMNTVPILMRQVQEIVEHLPEWTVQFQGWTHRVMDGKAALPLSVQRGFDESLDNVGQYISENIKHIVPRITSTISQLFNWMLVPFLAFYMLKDFQVMERAIPQFIPKSSRKKWLHLLRDVDEALGNYIRGQLLVCATIGILAYIGYQLIGLPYAFLLASIVGAMNVIPYLGPVIGALPALLVGMSISWKMVLFVLIVNVIVQILEGNIVSPQIVGRTLKLHPLMIIFALLVGGQIGGIIGLILAVPAVAVVKVVMSHLIQHYIHSR